MTDKEILYFAYQYLKEAANESMTIENDSTQAIFYNKCFKDISLKTDKGEFLTDKEVLFFAYQQLKKMAIDALKSQNDSMQIIDKWLNDIAKKLKQANISARIPCAVGDTVYLTHGFSEDIWDMEDKGVSYGDLTEIKKGEISALLTSEKTEKVYVEISIDQDTFTTVSASDYFDKYRIHPTAERAEAYVRWLSTDRKTVVYAVNTYIYEHIDGGRKAFSVFRFIDYNEIVGITPSGAKGFSYIFPGKR